MKLYYEENDYKIYQGNMLEVLDILPEESIDIIITDPPYEINFMNKGWDNSGIAFQKETWAKCCRVLKKGGMLLSFGGSRTFHRIACAIEDGGFEIRDTIMWLYGSGFPKSMNIGLAIDKRNGIDNRTGNIITNGAHNGTHFNLSGQQGLLECYEERKAQNEWAGWGTCLKPAYEPIIVARKPFNGSLIDNILENKVGGLNIDECRVENEHFVIKKSSYDNSENQPCFGNIKKTPKEYEGRFPANVILTYNDTDYNEVCGGMPNTKSFEGFTNTEKSSQDNTTHLYTNIKSGYHFGDSGSAARYFYCAKASKKDRDEGLNIFNKVSTGVLQGGRKEGSKGSIMPAKGVNPYAGAGGIKKNYHPTVKPVELMQYIIRLVAPKGATILDCFCGSGTTGKAVMFENRERDANYKFIGIELTEEYLPLIKARIDYAKNKYEYDLETEINETNERFYSLFEID